MNVDKVAVYRIIKVAQETVLSSMMGSTSGHMFLPSVETSHPVGTPQLNFGKQWILFLTFGRRLIYIHTEHLQMDSPYKRTLQKKKTYKE